MALNLGDLFSTLKLNIRPFVDGLKEANRATSGVAFSVNRVMGKSGRTFRMATYEARTFTGAVRRLARREVIDSIRRLRDEVRRSGMAFKDVRRIVGGIVISQIFYRMARQFQNLAESVGSFHTNTEVAVKTLTSMVGTEPRARAFLHVMEELAAVNPTVSAENIVATSKRMVAMGFEAASLLDLMTTITDTTSALGTGEQGFNSIIYALGQIKTNGRLAATEVKQLGEAFVPIRSILAEELNLKPEDFLRLGDLNIAGEKAVQAIVRGMKKRFGGMGEIIADTAFGALDVFKSNALLLLRSMTQEWFEGYRAIVIRMRDTAIEARKIFSQSGMSGLFDRFIPPRLNVALRAIIGSFQQLTRAVGNLWQAIRPLLAAGLQVFLVFLAQVLPLLTWVILQLTRLIKWVATATPLLRGLAVALAGLFIANAVAKSLLVLWKVMRLGMIVTLLVRAIVQLVTILRVLGIVLMASPKVAIILALVIAFAMLTGISKTLGRALDDLMKRFNALYGLQLGQVLSTKGEDKMGIDALNEFTKEYGEAVDDIAAIGKKVKRLGVASFDEVFTISSPDALTNDLEGLLEDLQDFDIGGDFTESIMEAMDELGYTFPTLKEMFATFWKWFEDQAIAFNQWVNSLPGRFADWVVRSGKAAWKWFEDQSIMFNRWAEETSKIIVDWVLDTAFALGGWMITTGKNGWKWFEDQSILFNQWSMETARIIGDWILDTAFALGGWMIDTLKAGWKWFEDQAILFNQWSKDTAKIIGDWILETAFNMGSWIINTSKNSWKWFEDQAILFNQWSKDTAKIIGDWILDTAFAMGSWMITTGQNGWKWFEDQSIMFNQWSKDTAKIIADWIVDTITAAGTWVADQAILFNQWSTKTLADIKQWGKDAPHNFKLGVQALGQLILDTFTDWGIRLRDWFYTIGAMLYEAGSDWWDTLKRLGDDRLQAALSPFRRLSEGIQTAFSGLQGFFKNLLNANIIRPLNKLIANINKLNIGLPEALGGGSLGFDLAPVPELRTGGLVQRETLARLGEGNKREAVIPLERGDVVRQFAEAIADVLGNREGSGTPNYYMIGTLIGDDRSLTELERRLQVTRLDDQTRMGGVS